MEFSGFKAHQVHTKCLNDRNATLISMFGSSFPLEIRQLLIDESKDVIVPWEGVNVTIHKCNIEEELENVGLKIFSI